MELSSIREILFTVRKTTSLPTQKIRVGITQGPATVDVLQLRPRPLESSLAGHDSQNRSLSTYKMDLQRA